jgi:hypothetical protein
MSRVVSVGLFTMTTTWCLVISVKFGNMLTVSKWIRTTCQSSISVKSASLGFFILIVFLTFRPVDIAYAIAVQTKKQPAAPISGNLSDDSTEEHFSVPNLFVFNSTP